MGIRTQMVLPIKVVVRMKEDDAGRGSAQGLVPRKRSINTVTAVTIYI